MSDVDRREFLLKTVQAAGGVFAYSLLTQNVLAEEVSINAVEAEKSVDENFWVGGY